MSQMRDDVADAPTVSDFARALKPNLAPIADHVVRTVQASVAAYRGEASERPLNMAIEGALTVFAEGLIGPSATGPRVDRMFRQMGYVEAQRDEKLADFHRALYVSVREAHHNVRNAARDFGLDTDLVDHVSNAAFVFADHVADQVSTGRESALARAKPRSEIRDALITALVDGSEDAVALAEEAEWPIPDQMVVLATAGLSGGVAPSAPGGILARDDGSLVLCAAADEAQALAYLDEAVPNRTVAVTWPVPLAEVQQAAAWAHRLIRLARRGIVEPAPVLHCADYRTEIWLHGEPALRQRLCQDLLGPLLAETANSREVFSETLMTWLPSRESAKEIGVKLGVHAQTIRYRWKRINELFGEDLRDPEFVVQLTMLLRASLPLWKAGDHSDFERFEARDSRDGD